METGYLRSRLKHRMMKWAGELGLMAESGHENLKLGWKEFEIERM